MARSAMTVTPTVLEEAARDWCQWLERDTTDQVRRPWLLWVGEHPKHAVAYQRAAWPGTAGPRLVKSRPTSKTDAGGLLYNIAAENQCAEYLYDGRWKILLGPNSSLVLRPKENTAAPLADPKGPLPSLGPDVLVRRGVVILSSQGTRGKHIRISVGALDIYTSSGTFVLMNEGDGLPERVLLIGGSALATPFTHLSSNRRLQSGHLVELVRSQGATPNALQVSSMAVDVNLTFQQQMTLLNSSPGLGWYRWTEAFKWKDK